MVGQRTRVLFFFSFPLLAIVPSLSCFLNRLVLHSLNERERLSPEERNKKTDRKRGKKKEKRKKEWRIVSGTLSQWRQSPFLLFAGASALFLCISPSPLLKGDDAKRATETRTRSKRNERETRERKKKRPKQMEKKTSFSVASSLFLPPCDHSRHRLSLFARVRLLPCYHVTEPWRREARWD